MKAAVLRAVQVMPCIEVETPIPKRGEALVRVAYCGVCGSDVPRFLDGAVHAFPIILGHEFSGTVEALGEGVDNSILGTRVSCIPLKPCMDCEDCKSGNYSLCKHYGFIGSRQNGAYAEYVALPAENLFPVPEGVTDLQAAFFEPATVAQHAINLVNPVPPGDVAVLGCGTIGIFTAAILKAAGFRVTAFARRESRLAAARSAGVANLVDTSRDGWLKESVSALPRRGYDYIFDTSGNGDLMVQSFELAANKATVCMVGTPKRPMRFGVREWENLNRKELTVTGSWMSYSSPFPGNEWEVVARAFACGSLAVTDEMVDAIYPLEGIEAGMKRFGVPNSISGKLLVKP